MNASDIENDYLFIANLQSVIIDANLASGDLQDTAVQVDRMDANVARTTFSQVSLQGETRQWIIFKPELSNLTTIEAGYTITEADGTIWRINDVRMSKWDTQFHVNAVKNR